MNPKNLISLSLAISLLSCLCAFGDDPILDLKAEGADKISDDSSYHRAFKINAELRSTGEDSVLLPKEVAVSFPYSPEDPLFQSDPTTWILRIKAGNVSTTERNIIAGRWDAQNDRRSIGLSFSGPENALYFFTSATGNTDSIVGCKSAAQILPGEWITVVATYEPKVALTVQLFDSTGKSIDSAKVSKSIPAGLYENPAPFVLGASASMKLEFSRLRVWNDVLSDEAISDAVRSK